MDFANFPRRPRSRKPVEPVELFRSLKVTDSAVNDLWLAQGDALRQWHESRGESDVAIVLNTGAGKTLVGLLVAQSLVNETKGHVLYACSSIQLVEQTAAKAAGYGLEVTSYFRGSFDNDLYQQGLAPCITTYQALFNGKSIFFKEQLYGRIRAIVFDDAHTAEHLLRDHFTLRISRNRHANLYDAVTNLFRSYFARVGLGVGYSETLTQDDHGKSQFVPPFAVRDQLAELQRLLVDAKLNHDKDAKFAWEYIKNHVDLCAVFVSGADISFTPPVVPVLTLPYFRDDVRRVYLSATLAANDGFLRTFGKLPSVKIAPSTTAGECERLIIIPARHSDTADDVTVGKAIVQNKKALVLVPSYRQAERWTEVVTVRPNEDVTGQLEQFKSMCPPAVLLLVNRYDGVDLPGDTCRVMVIDGLPASLGPLERYFWERLGLGKSLRSTVASRVVQSFGRISRGMSDHGVVVLTGKDLVNWLLSPGNRAMLPAFLQKQLEIGLEVSKRDVPLHSLVASAQQCLDRDPDWIHFYQDNMAEIDVACPPSADNVESRVAEIEVRFGHALWGREYAQAAKCLEPGIDALFEETASTAAWHALWTGYCHHLLGDIETARHYYRRAHSAVKNIPAYELGRVAAADTNYSHQVIEVATYLRDQIDQRLDFIERMNRSLSALDGREPSPKTEEAIRALGEYLGLNSSRPDNEYKTGPDVLWHTSEGPVLCLELKTDKRAGSQYRKEELGQLRDHLQWVQEHVACTPVIPAFVGKVLPASQSANPGPDIRVIELQEFASVGMRVRAAIVDIYSRAVPATMEDVVHDVFKQRDLLWPRVFETMSSSALRNISVTDIRVNNSSWS